MALRILPVILTLLVFVAPIATLAQDLTAPPFSVWEHSTLGTILTDAEGWTLYRWDRDEPGVSNCDERCAQTWLPLLVESDPTGMYGPLGAITRTDGTLQLTYEGWPLYRNVRDQAPGDTNGLPSSTWNVISVDPSMMMEEM